ncbi:MAG: hypothetical protein KC516_01770 [Nanoarchaeota archaeon]|nr:hypothetical protein [Nanoarchaeota archaeon]
MKTQKKRRIERKTDYKRRMNLLKGNVPRLVFRRTNTRLLAQYVSSEEAKDKIIFGVDTKALMNYGWPKEFSGSLKSIPAAYLLGYLSAKKINDSKLEMPIVDLGMIRVLPKTKVFGFLKGLVDGGVKTTEKSEKFPEEERIQGKNLKEDFSKHFNAIKSKIESADLSKVKSKK